jgi:tRNA threonylcarbamoyl adenosine modification protein (Sua5/YciO/YrdC/YwlC family)
LEHLITYTDEPDKRNIHRAAEVLRSGGIVIYPTDTYYGLAADIRSHQAVERLLKVRGLSDASTLSLVCADFSHLSSYTLPIPNAYFRLMRRALPGPYTFILPASGLAPRQLQNRRKNIGLRIPDHPVAGMLISALGSPLASASLTDKNDGGEYHYREPDEILSRYSDEVDVFLDHGISQGQPSTLVDLTGDEPVLLREGKGVVFW